MVSEAEHFEAIVRAVVTRFLGQGGDALPAHVVERFAAQLRGVVGVRGLPRPLGDGECGAPGGMSEAECAPLVAAVLAGLPVDGRLTEAARQLVKACFYPEFTQCRESYREIARDGACRRQEITRARGRVSGSHCVDCPYWVALDERQHAELLAGAWRGDVAEFAAARAVFLPEDFRQLRRWLHAAARRPVAF